jgi:hypothetical protein
MNGNGYVSRLGNWAAYPLTTQCSLGCFALGFVLVLIIAYLWSRVVNKHVLGV